MLFHTLVELFSIVVAFAVFIVAWNSRHMQDNKYLHFVGISYIFIAGLDLLHTLSFKGMNVLPVPGYPANQFWVATRLMEALTLLMGFLLINKKKKLHTDLIFLAYFTVSVFLVLSILVWQTFPVCFIEGMGQTPFKIYTEYLIIAILIIAAILLLKNRKHFSSNVFTPLFGSIVCAILSECCFASYTSNIGPINELGHYGKLISFFLIYKANVEIGFIKPADYLFKNLKESEEQFRTLAENLPGLVLRYDQSIQCIYTNKLKINRDDFKSHVIQLLGPENIEQFEEWLFPKLKLVLNSGLPYQGSFQQHIDGNVHFFSAHIIPEHHREGIENTILVICDDVTVLRKTEHELQLINKTKDKLFSVIAHDLRNPFTALLSYSELIASRSESMDRKRIGQMATRMNETAKQTFALLENLLQWSRVQTGLLKPIKEPIILKEIFDQAIKVCLPLALNKNIVLEMNVSDSIIVSADRQMVAAVLRNLIINAIKFSFEGDQVLLEATSNQAMAIISVKDTGTGIPEENQDALLGIGNTLSQPGTAAESGTGLGLVLCKEFVSLNDGEIWLKSAMGDGTVFYFTLPLI